MTTTLRPRQRLVKSWRWDEFWPTAVAFYRRVEAETGSRFFESQRIVRLLANDVEQDFLSRRIKEESATLMRELQPPLNPESFDVSHGGFEMSDAGRLNVAAFLDASQQAFASTAQFITADLDLEQDVELTDGGVFLPRLGIQAERLIFCQGIDATSNPWFQQVRFNPAKGEILTLRINGLAEERIVQRGVWLMPLGNSLFRAGSTYEWTDVTPQPTPVGRNEICARLREFLRLPFHVVAHEAAIRPILRHQYPTLGWHPQHPQLGFFNGLGSKGALQAPWLAQHLAECLLEDRSLDPAISIERYTQPAHEREPATPITTVAQSIIEQTLQPGDIAIDATAGNGHDTVFLARCVGPSGRTFSFDIQDSALFNTAHRLADCHIGNVTLLNRSHAEMPSALPDEVPGQVAAVMFNLGYLPGGDKQLTTQTDSTLKAIHAALSLLKAGGIMTIIAYPGHEAGASETLAVQQLLEDLPKSEFNVAEPPTTEGRRPSPRLFVVQRILE